MEPNRASGRPDLELVSPFILAAAETFKVQYSMALTHRDPYRRADKPAAARELVSVFSVFSFNANVAVAFCFPQATYEGILQKMGVENANAAEVEDGVRELVNIIFNKVKKLMNTDGRLIHRSIPAMISGNGLKVWYLTTGETVVVPFQVNGGDFEIELTLES